MKSDMLLFSHMDSSPELNKPGGLGPESANSGKWSNIRRVEQTLKKTKSGSKPSHRLAKELQELGIGVLFPPQEPKGKEVKEGQSQRVLVAKGKFPPKKDNQSTSREEHQLDLMMVARPWLFLERIAQKIQQEEVDLSKVLRLLDSDERRVRAARLLLADDEGRIKSGLELLQTLDEKDRLNLLMLISQSEDGRVRAIVKKFLEENQIALPKAGNQRVDASILLQPLSEYDIAAASSLTQEEVHKLLSRPKKEKDLGKMGKLKISSPSLFEEFIKQVTKRIEKDPSNLEVWIRRLTRLVDVLRYKGQLFKINNPGVVETVITLVEQISPKGGSLKSVWDFLVRFELNSSELSASILKLMEAHQDLGHPLAPALLSQLDEEHPFYKEQVRRIAELKRLVEGSVEKVFPRFGEAEDLAKKIVTIFPKGKPSERFGFDAEMWPSILGVSLPKGVNIGVDGSGEIPELRLEPTPGVLAYDPQWRQRLADMYLWGETSKVAPASIHLHVDRSKKNLPEQRVLMRMLFGESINDLNEQDSPPTFEVRIALQDYPIPSSSKAVPFKDGWNFIALADFMVAIKSSQCYPDFRWEPPQPLNPIAKRWLTVLRLTNNPEARAAAIIALHRNMGLRIVGRDFASLEGPNLQALELLAAKWQPTKEREIDFMERIVEESGGDEMVIGLAIHQLPHLDLSPEEKMAFVKRVTRKAVSPSGVEAVVRQLPYLDIPPKERKAFVKEMIKKSENDVDVAELMIRQLHHLSLPKKERIAFLMKLIESGKIMKTLF